MENRFSPHQKESGSNSANLWGESLELRENNEKKKKKRSKKVINIAEKISKLLHQTAEYFSGTPNKEASRKSESQSERAASAATREVNLNNSTTQQNNEHFEDAFSVQRGSNDASTEKRETAEPSKPTLRGRLSRLRRKISERLRRFMPGRREQRSVQQLSEQARMSEELRPEEEPRPAQQQYPVGTSSLKESHTNVPEQPPISIPEQPAVREVKKKRTLYPFVLYLHEYRKRKKLEKFVNKQRKQRQKHHEEVASMQRQIAEVERERARQQRRIEQLESFMEAHVKSSQTVAMTEETPVSSEHREQASIVSPLPEQIMESTSVENQTKEQGADTYPHRKSFRQQHQQEQKSARKSSPSFERFRDYLEHKRRETRERTQSLKQLDVERHGPSKGTNERLSTFRRSQKEQQPLLERTKQSYEKYRQYIDRRMIPQLSRTQHVIARRQRHKTSYEQSQRQQRQQYDEQRSNLILAVLVFTLLVLVAISIVQLVV